MSSTTPEAQPPADAPRTEAPKVAPQALMGLLLRDTALLLAGCAALLYFCGASWRLGWLGYWGAHAVASAPPLEQMLYNGAIPLLIVALSFIYFHLAYTSVATGRRRLVVGATAGTIVSILHFLDIPVLYIFNPVLLAILAATMLRQLAESAARRRAQRAPTTQETSDTLRLRMHRTNRVLYGLFVFLSVLVAPFFMGRIAARFDWQSGDRWQLTTADGQQRIVVIIDSTPEQLIVALVSGSQRPTTLEVIRDDSLRHLKLTRLP